MNNPQATLNKMIELRLHGMTAAYRNLLETGKNMSLSNDEVITYLIDAEWDQKHNRRLQRLIKAARFRYQASLEELDYTLDRNLDQNQILHLCDCSWVTKGQDILITGPTGVGKSYLATALGFQACQYGHATGYYLSSRLWTEIEHTKQDGTYFRMMSRIMKHKVLIIDDFGLENLTATSRLAFLEILEDRHKRKPIVIVSQLPVKNWHEMIGEPTIADAVMDRLVYHSHRIELKGESVRRKMYGID